jgi:hypothetical protein
MPLWAWEAGTNLWNNGGVLALFLADGYPTSLDVPGAIYNNGLSLGVVPGVTPSPIAMPVYFGMITADALFAMGGGNLPVDDPGEAGQLWNNGGEICVSAG